MNETGQPTDRTSEESRPPASPLQKGRRLGRRLIKGGLWLLGLFFFGWYILPWFVPLPKALLLPPESSVRILDREGQPLHSLVRHDFHRHRWVRLADIPPNLIHATLAAEDKRFREHGGADFLAIGRAIKDGWEAKRVVSGASTISQQLIKITSPPTKRIFWVKIREALGARRLEMSWSKDKILEEYLNRIDYGNLCLGSEAAADFYFNKRLSDLSLAECALLAGLPQAPSRLNPLKHPESARKRQQWVLLRMKEVYDVPVEAYERAVNESLVFTPRAQIKRAPHVIDWLSQNKKDDLAEEGEITTTIDAEIQASVETIVESEMKKLRDRNVEHAAVLVMDSKTADVLAWVGSSDYYSTRGGQINGALATRSAGSTLKPFTYLLAFERGAAYPGSILPDVPSPFRTDYGIEAPQNYDRKFRGPVSIRTALSTSLNVPAMRALNDLGGVEVLADAMKSLGFTTLDEDVARYGLGLTIGNAEVTLLELTSAFSCLARLGVGKAPRLLLNVPPSEGKRLFRPETCFAIADILSDNVARSVAFGLGSPLRLPFPVAVKTGTSTDFRDNWCVGYTPEYTVGVWVGNFTNTPMKGMSGVDGAGPVFHEVMLRLHRDKASVWYQAPEGLEQGTIDVRTGRVMGENQPPHVKTATEWFFTKHPPLMASNDDYEADGRVLLDERYASWLKQTPAAANEFALESGDRATQKLRPVILVPAEGATYFIDPELPGAGRRLNVKSNLPGDVEWICETLSISQGSDGYWLDLAPGTHRIMIRERETGREANTQFVVKNL